MHFPDKSLVEHQECKRCIGDKGSGPAIIGSVKSIVDLIQVVCTSHSPFPVIILENVVAVVELVWVSLSFSLYKFKFER